MKDVCVAGGGPAGASLALRLARLGRGVTLIEKAMFPRRHVGESLTGGILPLLEVLGLREAVDSAGFLASDWATVEWAGQRRRNRLHQSGWQVDRARFDSMLLDAAMRAGVEIHQPARIVEQARIGGRWRIRTDRGAVFECRYLADAAGRARLLPGRKQAAGAAALAMYAYWSGARQLEGNDTLVEAGESCWYWGAPLPGGEFNATVFVDRGEPLTRDRYLTLVRQSVLLRPLLEHGSCGGMAVCDATPFLDDCPVTGGSIKAGDAAISIDPLSSQGVQTAIGTALHAAIVLNTLMDYPERADLASDFYRVRLAESSAFHSAAAARLYGDHYAVCDTPFWEARTRSQTKEAPRAAPDLLTPETWVSLSSEVAIETMGVATESHIAPAVGVTFRSRRMVYAGGILLAPLLRQVTGAVRAGELARAWSRLLPAQTAWSVLVWAWTEGILLAPETPSR